jgi:hypothetical protein
MVAKGLWSPFSSDEDESDNDDVSYDNDNWDGQQGSGDTGSIDFISTATIEADVDSTPPLNSHILHQMFNAQERHPETDCLVVPVVKINPDLSALPVLRDFLEYNDEVATLRAYVLVSTTWLSVHNQIFMPIS